MEIERKFLLPAMPPVEPVAVLEQWQGYLCTNPEVRIRRTVNHTSAVESFILCIKSKGDLSRHEVEAALTGEQFEELTTLLEHPLIHKEQRVFRLQDGHMLECSVVDGGVFSYAEVEFTTEAEAKQWTPPAWLGRELTYLRAFSMSSYWSNRDLFRELEGE